MNTLPKPNSGVTRPFGLHDLSRGMSTGRAMRLARLDASASLDSGSPYPAAW